jgi:hypothetical protein
MKQIIRPISVLVASGVAALALLAACGGDPGKATSTAAREQLAAAATARLNAEAEQYEWSAHLQGQTRTYGTPAMRQDAVSPNPTKAGNRAAADRLERNAKLEGHARTYGKAGSSQDPPAPADEEFVPGSRHMPTR